MEKEQFEKLLMLNTRIDSLEVLRRALEGGGRVVVMNKYTGVEIGLDQELREMVLADSIIMLGELEERFKNM